MKLFSGSGNRVNNSRNARGSENGAASRQSRSSSYSGAVWEDEEPRVVKADGSATSRLSSHAGRRLYVGRRLCAESRV